MGQTNMAQRFDVYFCWEFTYSMFRFNIDPSLGPAQGFTAALTTAVSESWFLQESCIKSESVHAVRLTC